MSCHFLCSKLELLVWKQTSSVGGKSKLLFTSMEEENWLGICQQTGALVFTTLEDSNNEQHPTQSPRGKNPIFHCPEAGGVLSTNLKKRRPDMMNHALT